jgi:formate C-acetyltransferase
MEGTALKGPEAHAELAGCGFRRGAWTSAIDVREFIVANAMPYDGDESFVVGPTARTQATSIAPTK